MPTFASDVISAVFPVRAVPGGRVTLYGDHFDVTAPPAVTLGGVPARLAFTSPSKLVVLVPGDLDGGDTAIALDGVRQGARLQVGSLVATGLHQVDNPVFDRAGNLFVTYSGARGQEAPVSIFRVTPSGTREPFASGVVNATSMAFGPDDQLYVTSRFEGAVYRVDAEGVSTQVASELGVACGIAFDADGWMYVGDRSGTIFRVRNGRATAFATLPSSIAAFHLAMGPDGDLFVSAPTLSTYDYVYRIDRYGDTRQIGFPMGRPQGLAFGPDGALYVADALAGASGIYRVPLTEAPPERVVTGGTLIGLAFGPSGEMVVASNEAVYRFSQA